jgi:hypothetical protein
MLENQIIPKENLEFDKKVTRFHMLINYLAESARNSGTERPYYNLLSGGIDVENQQIQLYYEYDLNKLTFRFKITEYSSKIDTIIKRIKEITNTDELNTSYLRYTRVNSQDKIQDLLSQEMDYDEQDIALSFLIAYVGRVYHLNYNDAEISFDSGSPLEYNQYGNMGDSRTTSGIVSISFDIPNNLSEIRNLLSKFENICKNFFDINTILEIPNLESTTEYKKNRLRWLLKTTDEPDSSELSKMKLISLNRGYKTYTYTGFSEMLRNRYGEFCFVHELSIPPTYLEEDKYNSVNSLISILKRGLVCSSERYKSGEFVRGSSSINDLHSGGGDYVFTRLITDSTFIDDKDSLTLILLPQLADRTDWFSYDKDMYGSTDPEFFKNRLSPFEIFEYENESRRNRNEVMFRNSVSPKSILALACGSEETRNLVLNILHRNNILEVNEVPIEDFVVVSKKGFIYNFFSVRNNR